MPVARDANMRYTVMPTIVSVKHGDAMVLLDPKSGQYYTLNGVGSVIWGVLCDGGSPVEIGSTVARQFDVDEQRALADAIEFFGALSARRLIRSLHD
jgi:Coenzyme PQQ synthesis protein D (PqqD)